MKVGGEIGYLYTFRLPPPHETLIKYKGEKSKFTMEKLGNHHFNQMTQIIRSVMWQIKTTCPLIGCYEPHFWTSLPKMYKLNAIRRKHQKNPSWGLHYDYTGNYPFCGTFEPRYLRMIEYHLDNLFPEIGEKVLCNIISSFLQIWNYFKLKRKKIQCTFFSFCFSFFFADLWVGSPNPGYNGKEVMCRDFCQHNIKAEKTSSSGTFFFYIIF